MHATVQKYFRRQKRMDKDKMPNLRRIVLKRPLQDETIHKVKAEGACCTICAMKMNMK